MGDIVSLYGQVIPGVPVPEIVELLREALSEAERGELQSVAVTLCRLDGSSRTDWASTQSPDVRLIGVANLLALEMAAAALNE